MNLLPVLAQSVTFVDARIVPSLISLLASLGAASMAVSVTRSFLGLLRRKAEGQSQFIEHFKRSHAQSQRIFQDQLDRLSDRHQQCQHDFQTYIARMSDAQDVILRDVIVVMNTIERAHAGSTITIHDMDTDIGTHEMSIRGIDTPLSGTAGKSLAAKPLLLT